MSENENFWATNADRIHITRWVQVTYTDRYKMTIYGVSIIHIFGLGFKV